MSTPKWKIFLMTIACAMAVPETARAQFAVIDVPAIAQLIQQVQMMEQALNTARAELQQAQQAVQAMTGNRGMQNLLNGTVRNYLPADWSQLAGTFDHAVNGYAGLGAEIQGLIGANAVLTAKDFARLSSTDQSQLAASRRTVAAAQAIARDALTNAGGRFTSIQSLITAIGSASDQKGILDLQARIAAEQGMLQNEQTKLQSIRQVLEAEAASGQQHQRELIIAAHGDFSGRFQPKP